MRKIKSSRKKSISRTTENTKRSSFLEGRSSEGERPQRKFSRPSHFKKTPSIASPKAKSASDLFGFEGLWDHLVTSPVHIDS